jgi:hypothetical protein
MYNNQLILCRLCMQFIAWKLCCWLSHVSWYTEWFISPSGISELCGTVAGKVTMVGTCQQKERHYKILSYLTVARYVLPCWRGRRQSLPIDMLLSATSLLVVALPSSVFPEALINYPVQDSTRCYLPVGILTTFCHIIWHHVPKDTVTCSSSATNNCGFRIWIIG